MARLAVVRSRLFRKYAVVLVGVVGIALVINGAFQIWSSLQERKDLLLRSQRQQAVAAEEKIEQFIVSVQSQLHWMTVRSWSADTLRTKYLNALWLLRRVPAITQLRELDSTGHEEVSVSRLSMDAVGSGIDRSQERSFKEAIVHQAYYGPVYFRHGSEPYMTIAVATTLPHSEVSAAEVNLKFIWAVVSKIDVGRRGYAYVVDDKGNLVAHPEINLVLRHTNLSDLAQIKAAEAGGAPVEVALDARGRRVLTAYARIAPLDWLVFVELPTDEAFAPLYRSVLRSGLILLAGLAFAVTAGLILARRMVVPIQALGAGATRLGSGDLSQRIVVHTGDEIEALADQFNDMASKLQESYAGLERKVEERTHQLELANLAKSRFIAAASHDLRQPLQALDLFVAQLRGKVAAPDRQRIIKRIGIAVAEMNDLFEALLDISKLDAGVVAPTLSEFPIASLLARIETTFAEAAHEKGLSFRVMPSEAWVHSDQRLLERILLNLAANAVRYTSRGGVIIGCRRRGKALRIEVYDTGAGIPADQRQRIFDEF
ncbi:MAG: sensor histidine kinase, partial [Alphaproteobacteria bacterium]|nr:sensor histidine kinase [Alphaproteobacteria bacterium]